MVCVVASGLENSTGTAAGNSGGGAGAAAATAGSSSTDEVQTVRICVELVGDISRALGPAFVPYSERLLAKMYQMLQVNVDQIACVPNGTDVPDQPGAPCANG